MARHDGAPGLSPAETHFDYCLGIRPLHQAHCILYALTQGFSQLPSFIGEYFVYMLTMYAWLNLLWLADSEIDDCRTALGDVMTSDLISA